MVLVDTVSGFFNSTVAIIEEGDWGTEEGPLSLIFLLGANIGLDGFP